MSLFACAAKKAGRGLDFDFLCRWHGYIMVSYGVIGIVRVLPSCWGRLIRCPRIFPASDKNFLDVYFILFFQLLFILLGCPILSHVFVCAWWHFLFTVFLACIVEQTPGTLTCPNCPLMPYDRMRDISDIRVRARCFLCLGCVKVNVPFLTVMCDREFQRSCNVSVRQHYDGWQHGVSD
jgi:hypothetical protein